MTPAELATYVRWKTGTDATTFSDANLMVAANVAIDDIAKEIVKTHKGFFGRIFTYNLVGDQRNYALDENICNGIRSIEAKIDGTNWKRLVSTDLSMQDNPTVLDADIRSAFFGLYKYEIRQKEIWLFCGEAIIAVTGGLVVRCDVYPQHLTSMAGTDDMSKNGSSTTRGLPRAVHELLARRIVIESKNSKDKPLALTQTEQKYEYDLAKAIEALRDSNQDEEIVAKLPFNDGSQY